MKNKRSGEDGSSGIISGNAKPLIVIIVLIVGIILVYSLITAYLDRYPWVFGGNGTPDVIWLDDGYRLEKVTALRKGYFIKDIRGGNMIFGRTAARNSGEINGAADLHGNVILPLGAHADDVWLTLDENGEVFETEEPYSVSEKADKPIGTIDVAGGKKAQFYDIEYKKLVSYEGTLGIIKDNGSVSSLFDTGSGNGWRLEDPRFFGEYVVVRIYWCDCVYRVTKNEIM